MQKPEYLSKEEPTKKMSVLLFVFVIIVGVFATVFVVKESSISTNPFVLGSEQLADKSKSSRISFMENFAIDESKEKAEGKIKVSGQIPIPTIFDIDSINEDSVFSIGLENSEFSKEVIFGEAVSGSIQSRKLVFKEIGYDSSGKSKVISTLSLEWDKKSLSFTYTAYTGYDYNTGFNYDNPIYAEELIYDYANDPKSVSSSFNEVLTTKLEVPGQETVEILKEFPLTFKNSINAKYIEEGQENYLVSTASIKGSSK